MMINFKPNIALMPRESATRGLHYESGGNGTRKSDLKR